MEENRVRPSISQLYDARQVRLGELRGITSSQSDRVAPETIDSIGTEGLIATMVLFQAIVASENGDIDKIMKDPVMGNVYTGMVEILEAARLASQLQALRRSTVKERHEEIAALYGTRAGDLIVAGANDLNARLQRKLGQH